MIQYLVIELPSRDWTFVDKNMLETVTDKRVKVLKRDSKLMVYEVGSKIMEIVMTDAGIIHFTGSNR